MITMITINKEKCKGCGLCVKDCVQNNIKIINKKATVQNVSCIMCGHCISICPQFATETSDSEGIYEITPNKCEKKASSQVFEMPPRQHHVGKFDHLGKDDNSDSYLNAVMSRRSIRNFTEQKVEQHLIDKFITAGRYSHTSANRQTNSYIIIQDTISQFRSDVINTLKQLSNNIKQNTNSTPLYLNYANIWDLSYEQLNNKDGFGFDCIFHKSNLILIVNGDNDTDVAIAATNIENLIYSLGLGMYFSTFIKVAIEKIHYSRKNLELQAQIHR